jgi:apolipoprotein N-acyltransferase
VVNLNKTRPTVKGLLSQSGRRKTKAGATHTLLKTKIVSEHDHTQIPFFYHRESDTYQKIFVKNIEGLLVVGMVLKEKLGGIVLAVTTGLLLTASFPKVDLGWFAWVALVPLLYAIKGASPRASFGFGFLTGMVHYGTLLYWIVGVINYYGHVPTLLSVSIFILLLLYLSLYPGLFAVAVSQLRERSLPFYLIGPLFWVALEYVRSFLLSGFPWENLGYSQYDQLHLIQISDILGVYGLSALIMAVNGVLFEFSNSVLRNRTLVWIPFVAVGLVLGGFLAYGDWRIERTDRIVGDAPRRTIALAQGNIDQSVKWLPSFQNETLRRYAALSTDALKTNPDLIIWPETALPFYFLHDKDLTAETLQLVRTSGVHFVLGSPSFLRTGQGTRYYNSAYLVDPTGKIVGKYDKVHLVPYGEYVPLKRFFPFLGKLVEAVGDFDSGERGQVLSWGNEKIGMLICFEAIFPELARSMVNNGAQLLINITNDAWFGRSSAPYQHLSMVVFRAVENHLAVARAANTGISAYIDPVGRLLDQTPLFQEAMRSRALPVMSHETFYARHGDIFAIGCVLMNLVLGMGVFWRRHVRR